MAVTEERVSDLEATMQKLAYEHMNTEIQMLNSGRRHEEFKASMEEFKEFIRQDIAEMQAQKTEMNRKWGELANKMGTIVEDIVAPNIPTIGKQYFGVEIFQDFSLNRKKQHPKKTNLIREFDVIAVSGKHLFLNETKSTPRQEYLKAFVENHKEVFDYFPEYKDKTLVPIFSSLKLSESDINYLSNHGIYAMAMRGDTMDLLNFEEVQAATNKH